MYVSVANKGGKELEAHLDATKQLDFQIQMRHYLYHYLIPQIIYYFCAMKT